MVQFTRDGPTINARLVQAGAKSERLDQSHRVLGLEFQDLESKADKLKLEIDNSDLAEFDGPLLKKGSVLEVSWGYEGALAPTRSCVIQSVKGGTRLTVEAYAKSILMHKLTRSRSWKGLKKSQIAVEIAKEYGFASSAERFVEDTKQVIGTLVQARLTDAQFLARMAKQEGFVFFVDFDGFHFHKRDLGQKPLRVLHWYGDPGRGDVLSFSIENDISALAGAVTVKGRDPLRRKAIAATGSNADTKPAGVAPTIEVLAVDVNQRTKSVKTATAPASTEVLMCPASDAAGAKRVADARYRAAAQATVKIKLTIIGDPRLLAKTIVELRGFGKRLSGNYYVKAVTHKIGGGGYTCEIECVRNGHSEYGGTKSAGKVNAQKGPAKTSGSTGAGSSSEPLVVTVQQRDKAVAPSTEYKNSGGREDPVSQTSRQD